MAEDYINRIKRHISLDKENGWALGVCAGLAKYFRIDNAVVRVGTIVAALFFPKIVIATYLVAWLILDDRTTTTKESKADRFESRNWDRDWDLRD